MSSIDTLSSELTHTHPCSIGIGQLASLNMTNVSDINNIINTLSMWNNLTTALLALVDKHDSDIFSSMKSNLSACNDNESFASLTDLDYSESRGFFDIYYSRTRFICETTVAALSCLANVMAIVLTLRRRTGHLTVHQLLFLNLGISNVISCILAWLSNNVLYLFEEQFTYLLLQEMNLCKFFVYLSVGVFVSSATALVSTATVLGFITVQYIAICKPLEHPMLVRKSKVCLFILIMWITTIILGCVPFGSLLLLINHKECSATFLQTSIRVVIACVDYHVTLVGVLDMSAILMCARIYYEIRQLHRRLSRFRFDQDIKSQERQFVTSVLLLAIMTMFMMPYTLLYVVTLNKKDTMDLHDNALVYYMNLLPHAKFLSDPVVYGLRMCEVKLMMWRVWRVACSSHTCAGCKCNQDNTEHSYTPCSNTTSLSGSTSV